VASIVAEYEQYKLHAYLPTKNDRYTAGFGSTFEMDGEPIKSTDTLTLHKALDNLYDYLRGISKEIYILSPSLNNCELAGVTIFVYNVGMGNYKNSTMRKLIDTGHHKEAADEFLKWNKQGKTVLAGLTKRRLVEQKIFLSPKAPQCDY